MVSRKLSIRDEPNIRLRRSRNVKNHLFYRWKTSPCVRSKRPRLYRHHAHTCFNMCARGAGTHGDVLNVHTGTCWVDTRSFEACHTLTHTHINTHNTTQHNTLRPQHHTTDRDRDRQRQRQRQTETETERAEKRECGGAWPFFCWCSDLSG